jgi:hypothetical protein
MPTSTPSTNTSAYSALRKGADIHAKSKTAASPTAAEQPHQQLDVDEAGQHVAVVHIL